MSRMVVQACPAMEWFADLEGYTLTDDETYAAAVPALTGRGVVRGNGGGASYSAKYTGNVMGFRAEALTTGGTLVVDGDIYGMIDGHWFFVRAINSGNDLSVSATPKCCYAVAGGHQLYYAETWTDVGAAYEKYTFVPTNLTGTALDLNTWIGFQRT